MWAAPLFAALLAVLATCAVMAVGLSDIPDQARKAHKAPVPTGAGVAIALATGVALFLAASQIAPLRSLETSLVSSRTLAWVLALAGFGLALGLADDVWHLGARTKFLAVTVAALAFAAFVARETSLPFSSTLVLTLGPLGGIVGTALWIFTVANAVNFTDGANGLSMGASAIGLAGLATLCLIAGQPALAVMALTAAGSLVGYLYWNFPHGRVFAGDAGSLFVGMLVGGIGAVAASAGVPPWAIALCFLPQLADVLLTLAWRLRQKRNLLAGHREHLFQIGLRAGVSHGRMAVLYWVMTGHCALCAVAGSLLGPGGALIALIVNAGIGVVLSGKVRAFAAAHGHDGA